MGQAIYIVGFLLLNVILSCLSYQSVQPHPWGYNKRGEIPAYAGRNRIQGVRFASPLELRVSMLALMQTYLAKRQPGFF